MLIRLIVLDHLAVYTNIKTLYYAPETNITYVNYTSIQKKIFLIFKSYT